MTKAFLRVFDRINEGISVMLLLVTVVVVFLGILTRYVFKAPLVWTEEVGRFAFIWLVFVGVSITERQKAHFRITYFVEQAPPRVRYGLWLLGELLVIGALVIVLNESVKFARMGVHQISAVLQISLVYIYSALPLAVLLTLLTRVRNFVIAIQAGRDNPFS